MLLIASNWNITTSDIKYWIPVHIKQFATHSRSRHKSVLTLFSCKSRSLYKRLDLGHDCRTDLILHWSHISIAVIGSQGYDFNCHKHTLHKNSTLIQGVPKFWFWIFKTSSWATWVISSNLSSFHTITLVPLHYLNVQYVSSVDDSYTCCRSDL